MTDQKLLKIIKIVLLLQILFLTACASVAPKVLPTNRQNFNTALLRSDEEQLLLNIVRMQFGDRPYFLGVDSITLNSVLSASAGNVFPLYTITGTNNVPEGQPYALTNTVALSPNISVTDSPTIVYTPLQGEKFTRQLLTPISVEDIFLLIRSGWSVARVLRVTVEGVGDLRNAPSASRPSTKHVPEYKDFVKFAHHLRKLQLNKMIKIQAEKNKEQFYINIIIKDKYKNHPDILEVFKQLEIKPTHIIHLTDSEDNILNNILAINTRSLLGTLYYLSKSVQLSEVDIRDKIVEVPMLPNGMRFDWHNVTNGMIKIYSSYQFPSHASVAVFYRQRWFYIADSDSDSKETLAMVELLFSLRAGAETANRVPVITVPA